MKKSDKQTFIPPHGNYRELLSYQMAEAVYDLTFRCCERFLKKGERRLGARANASYETYRTYIDNRSAEVVANIAICLIHQANYLMDHGGSTDSTAVAGFSEGRRPA